MPIAAITALLAITCDIKTLRMIRPPLAMPDVVHSEYIPYPKSDAEGPFRLNEYAAGAFYGTLNGLLQRRFFPFWNESIPTEYAGLEGDSLWSLPFLSDVSVPWLFEDGDSNVLGSYANPTNRDFVNDGPRIVRGASLLKDTIDGDSVGMTKAAFDRYGNVPRYWLANLPAYLNFDTPKTVQTIDDASNTTALAAGRYVGNFILDDLVAQNSFSASRPFFLGDFAFKNLLGSSTPFSFHGYRELLDEETGLLPKWASDLAEAKKLKTLSTMFEEVADGGSDPLGSARGKAWGTEGDILSAFFDVSVLPSLDFALYSQFTSPRLWWGQFATANFVESLMQTQFLGMKQADWESQMVSPGAGDNSKWHSCPSVRYACQPFSGSFTRWQYAGAPAGSVTYQGVVGSNHSLDMTVKVDWTTVDSIIEDTEVESSDTLTLDDTIHSTHVTAGWFDSGGGVAYRIRPSITITDRDIGPYTETGNPDFGNPFYSDPAAATRGKWAIRMWQFDSGNHFYLDVVARAISKDADGNVISRDPNAVFSDGSHRKSYRQVRVNLGSPGDNLSSTIEKTTKLQFQGRVPVSRCDFTGPTWREAGGQPSTRPDDKSLWPMTFNHELYDSGVLRTRINSFTTIGFSTERHVAIGCAYGDFESYGRVGMDEEAVSKSHILTRHQTERNDISSPGSWYSAWNRAYSTASIKDDIETVATTIREYLINDEEGSSSDKNHAIYMEYNLPTIDAATNLTKQALKYGVSNAWNRLTINKSDTFTIHPTYTQSEVDIEFTDPTNFVFSGILGSLHGVIGNDTSLQDSERRRSIGVAYEKRCLPFAYWKFPSMNGSSSK